MKKGFIRIIKKEAMKIIDRFGIKEDKFKKIGS